MEQANHINRLLVEDESVQVQHGALQISFTARFSHFVLAYFLAEDGDVEIDSDSECEVDDDDIAAEEGGGAADMLEHATYWDHFLAYIDAKSVPWAEGEADSDEYRKQRAYKQFNLGMLVSTRLIRPTHLPFPC